MGKIAIVLKRYRIRIPPSAQRDCRTAQNRTTSVHSRLRKRIDPSHLPYRRERPGSAARFPSPQNPRAAVGGWILHAGAAGTGNPSRGPIRKYWTGRLDARYAVRARGLPCRYGEYAGRLSITRSSGSHYPATRTVTESSPYVTSLHGVYSHRDDDPRFCGACQTVWNAPSASVLPSTAEVFVDVKVPAAHSIRTLAFSMGAYRPSKAVTRISAVAFGFTRSGVAAVRRMIGP